MHLWHQQEAVNKSHRRPLHRALVPRAACFAGLKTDWLRGRCLSIRSITERLKEDHNRPLNMRAPHDCSPGQSKLTSGLPAATDRTGQRPEVLVYTDSAKLVVLARLSYRFPTRGRIPPFLGVHANEIEQTIEGLHYSPDVVQVVQSIFSDKSMLYCQHRTETA